MKLLAINHFFEQDLEALRETNPGHEMAVVHASLFHDAAARCFPRETFTDVSGYSRHGKRWSRLAYALATRRLLATLRKGSEFDLLIVPSDSIFYLREPIRALRKAGIATVVVQKETGMSPWTMRVHAKDTGLHVPFMADAMTVNSELHKEFWVASGAPIEKISVTGQPRFDYYASQADAGAAKARLGLPSGRKAVVFLSYMLSAYVPGEVDTWAEQREATERALIEQCRSSGAVLLVKPHPQQPIAGYVESLRAMGADMDGDVRIVEPTADTRTLLTAADVIVGFQSTAMYEAVASGTPTVYAGWAPEAAAIGEELFPLWDLEPTVLVAHSSADLRGLVAQQLASPQRFDRSTAKQVVEPQLGPLDGGASERVWAVLEQHGRGT